MLESCYRDFTLGLRSLRRNPVFAITAILTLAVGIGANTVVFTLLYGLLLRESSGARPGSLVRLGVASTTIDASRASSIPYQMLLQLRRHQKSFHRHFCVGKPPSCDGYGRWYAKDAWGSLR
jgi:hypothetical protein